MECFVERLKQTIPALHKAAPLQPLSFEAQSLMQYLIGRMASNQSDALVLSNPDIQAVDLSRAHSLVRLDWKQT